MSNWDEAQSKEEMERDYFEMCVSDPDWILIQSGQWIQIWIRNPDPDPGGQKWLTKIEKN